MKKDIKFLLSVTICSLVAVILAITSLASIKLGDADGDEKAISVSDARQILRFAVGLDTPKNDEIKAAADVDRDGNITVTDARTVLRAAVGLEPIADVPAIQAVETVETVAHEETTRRAHTTKRENTKDETTTERNADIVTTTKTAESATESTTEKSTTEAVAEESTAEPITEPTTETTTESTTEATTETESCEHNFAYKPVAASEGDSDWSNGTHIETCTKCGVTINEPVSCTLDGDIIYFKDSDGNDILPTCEKAANYYRACSVCGGKKHDSLILQHKFNSENAELATVTKAATCTEAGEITAKCELCMNAEKTFTVRALGHEIDDKTLAEGETVKCSRCGEELKPADFDYDDNELLTYLSGTYYFSGKMKTLVYDSSNQPVFNTDTQCYEYEESDVTIAINPGQSIYMMMPIDDSSNIGYLAFTYKKWYGKTVTEKYFETEHEGTRYYFLLDDSILKTMGMDSSDDLSFPGPSDPEFNTKIEGVDLRQLEQAQVVYQGNVCTRLTYTKDADNILRIYMNGKKLLLVETLNKDGIITGATYFDTITSEIPSYMTTTDGVKLSGILGLTIFAGYLGMFAE